MTELEIKKIVIETLRGGPVTEGISEITESTDPHTDLGKDSHDGIDFACALEASMEIEIPTNVNPFVDDELKKFRNVGEIIELVCALLA